MSTQPRTAAPRERMIDATITLLRRAGLTGAGINEIVRESGAPKGSVYHFFPDGKAQIVAEALGVYTQRVVAFIDAAMSGARTPATKVEALFAAFAKRVEQGAFLQSCPAGTVCLDLDAGQEPLRVVVADALDAYLAAIEKHLPLGNRGNARSFAGLLLTAIEGAYIRSRAERSGRAFREAGAWLAPLAAQAARRRPRYHSTPQSP